MLTTRFIAFGNGVLRSLHDRSHGFFRRQIILSALPRDPDRVDDPDLSQKLLAERDEIFMWSLAGLYRLMEHDFRFTISDQARENLRKAEREGNHIPDFLGSTGYIAFDYHAKSSSKQIYASYQRWCEDNALKPLSERTFSSFLRDHELELELDYTNHVPIGNGKSARGFRGIRLCG